MKYLIRLAILLLLLLLLLSRFSHVRLCVTPEMAAHQAPPSLGFSRPSAAVWQMRAIVRGYLCTLPIDHFRWAPILIGSPSCAIGQKQMSVSEMLGTEQQTFDLEGK